MKKFLLLVVAGLIFCCFSETPEELKKIEKRIGKDASIEEIVKYYNGNIL